MRLTLPQALSVAGLAAALVLAVLVWPRTGAAPVVRPVVAVDDAARTDAEPMARRNAGAEAVRALRVLVVDAKGEPVRGAFVALVSLADGTAVEAVTGADGVHAFDPPRSAAATRVVANGDGFLPVAEDLGPGGDVRLVLRRAPRVRVTVRDAVSGEPVLPFTVVVLPVPEEPAPVPVEPPPGSVRVERAGPFEVQAAAEGPHDVLVFAARHAAARARIDLRADEVVDVDVPLRRGILLRGRVRDHEGTPVVEAPVMLQSVDGATAAAVTTADGSFAFAPLPEGLVALLVQPEALPFLRVPSVELRSREPEPFLELQLPKGCEVRGRVVPWQAGQQAEVVLAHEDGPVRRVAVDAESGTFAARDLHDGVHRVLLERTEREWRNRVARALPPAVERIELRTEQALDVEVQDPVPTLARVHGRVVGGSIARGLVVRAFGEDRPLPALYEGLLRANVGEDGTFAIEGLLPGRWRLQAMRGDDVLAWQAIQLGPAQDLEAVIRLP